MCPATGEGIESASMEAFRGFGFKFRSSASDLPHGIVGVEARDSRGLGSVVKGWSLAKMLAGRQRSVDLRLPILLHSLGQLVLLIAC